MCKTQSLALSHCAEQVQERPYLNIIFGLAVKIAVNAPHWKATGLLDTSTKLYDAGKIQQNLRVARCLVLRQAKEGRAGNTCPGYPVGHSCPQFSPCAGTNKAPPSSDPVWCICLATLSGFAFSNGSGVWLSAGLDWQVEGRQCMMVLPL